MGFFDKLKSAMGYSGNDYDEDDELDGFNPSHRTPYVNPFKKEDPVPDLSDLEAAPGQDSAAVTEVKAAPVAEVEEKLPDGVFDGIITIINGNLPEFVRDCIDIEKERKAVSIAMGPQFRDYVLNLRRNSLEEARRQWIDERNTLNQRLNQSNQRADEAVRKATEIKDRLMSEERQRRAIVERSHDLESRISELEAQHEQDQLQNKGLLNKIKVMQLQVTDLQKDAEEIARLNAVVNEQRQKLMSAAELETRSAEYEAEISSLKLSVAQWQAKASDNSLEQEFKEKMEVANALINELQSAAAAKEKETKTLAEKLRVSGEEIGSLQEELKSAREELEIAAEIQEKIEQFEVIKQKKDAEIASLSKKLAEADTSAASGMEKVNASLRESQMQADELRSENAALKQQLKSVKDESLAHNVDLANQIDALNKKLDSKDMSLAKCKAELEDALKQSEKLIDATNKYKSDNMVLDVQVKNLKANIKDRDSELRELRSMLEENGMHVGDVVADYKHDADSGSDDVAVVSAIDEIDNIDWLMPSPPSEPEPETEPVAEAEERKKHQHDIGSAQMSLFDD